MTIETTGGTFKKIRARSVPLCAFESADPAHTINQCLRALNGKGEEIPLCEYDIIRGLVGLNEAGRALVQGIVPQGMDARLATGNPAECLTLLGGAEDKLLERAIVFWHQAHRQIGNEAVSQGFWNVRDKFKAIKATLVLLAPALVLPPELKQDIMVVSEPLPDEAELAKIVAGILEDAELADKVPEADRPVIVDILRGLSAFAAEQVMYLSLTPAGVDKAGLWERKRMMIEQTPGLSVWQGAESFNDLGGLENLKEFLRAVLTSGKTPVRAIGFIDEIEKGLAGSAGDTSGTSQDQLQVFLKVMQDLNVPGIILIGHAGTGKSAIAKAAGGVAGCPVISIDTGAMKGSLVGESEQRIRAAMDVFKAVSQGKGLFIATCNKIASLPPELRRRFTLGTFFVDLPTKEEQAGIWDIWLKRYEMTGAKLPPCEGWTGAEIRACCDVAYRTGKTLIGAASFVVPVIKSAPDQVESLRNQATGRFLSASAPGIYSKPEKQGGA
jgi:hypothetical protein